MKQQQQPYDARAMEKRLNAVMKTTNQEINIPEEQKELQRLKHDLEQHQANLKEAVTFMKKILQQEILTHLKYQHGIFERSDAEWYYSDTLEWAKQYCIFTWGEDKEAVPKYWCDSGCVQCDKLYKLYKPQLDICDENRLKSIEGVKNSKQDLKRYEFEQNQKNQNQNMNYLNKPKETTFLQSINIFSKKK